MLLQKESHVSSEIVKYSLNSASKKLDKSLQKININRQLLENSAKKYIETDWSLIKRAYCVWAKITPTHIDIWNTEEMYKIVERVDITMNDGVIL